MKTSSLQARQNRQRFVSNEDYLDYELGQAIKKLPPLYTRFLAAGMSMLLFGTLTWAYFSRVDEVAVAQGKLTPSKQMRPVRSLNAGSIEVVNIEAGDRVKKGDILIQRDSTMTETEIDQLLASAKLIREDLARLEAERSGNNVEAGVSLQDQLLASRLQDFQARRTAAIAEAKGALAAIEQAKIRRKTLLENLNNAKTNLTQTESQRVNAQTLFSKAQTSLKIAQQQSKALKSLVAPGAIPRLQYLDSQNTVVKAEVELTRIKDEMTRVNKGITEAQDKVISLENEFTTQAQVVRQAQQTYQAALTQAKRLASERQTAILARLNQRQEELTSLEGKIAEAKKRLEQETIKAPISGKVYNIKATLGPVQGGEELLSILPEGEEITLEANVMNQDIGFISKGMDVKVKIATFPFQEFGTVDGKVLDISADAIADEKLGLVFPVTVKLNKHSLKVRGEEVDLTPGMVATGEIVTRKKSVLSFLIEPVAKRLSEAFSVR